ncbi:MAG TPA: hypothetical protein VFA04_10330, partial [Bryobacteraceae bacterium]|nr:hypothetical protein [Bryobacteraceae bacterium]
LRTLVVPGRLAGAKTVAEPGESMLRKASSPLRHPSRPGVQASRDFATAHALSGKKNDFGAFCQAVFALGAGDPSLERCSLFRS